MKKFIFLLLPMIIFISSCRNSRQELSQTVTPQIHIKAEPVIQADITDTVKIYGEVRLRNEAMLASQFDGRLTEFSLLIGDKVNKKQQVGIIIPPRREALLQVMNRISSDLRPMLKEQIKSIPLSSPVQGTVLEVFHHSGDVLQKGETIVHIGNLNTLDIYGDLPITYINSVKKLKNISVEFVNFSHKPVMAPIEAVNGKVDKTKQIVILRLRLDNPHRGFRPGMLVTLKFPGKSHKSALLIPRAALLEEEGVYNVFVVKGNKVEKRFVKPGIFNNNKVEILSGLKQGELIATQKAYSLIDGMEVIAE
ncbi:efflux RND transporter periplasmic adaptor subunit [bacterium]|nr:efflux RND transporter periplasmic adaptor subunit [bacterium]